MDDLESEDELIDTPLISPFLDSDDESHNGEVLNELDEYENERNFYPNRIINSFDGNDLAFPCAAENFQPHITETNNFNLRSLGGMRFIGEKSPLITYPLQLLNLLIEFLLGKRSLWGREGFELWRLWIRFPASFLCDDLEYLDVQRKQYHLVKCGQSETLHFDKYHQRDSLLAIPQILRSHLLSDLALQINGCPRQALLKVKLIFKHMRSQTDFIWSDGVPEKEAAEIWRGLKHFNGDEFISSVEVRDDLSLSAKPNVANPALMVPLGGRGIADVLSVRPIVVRKLKRVNDSWFSKRDNETRCPLVVSSTSRVYHKVLEYSIIVVGDVALVMLEFNLGRRFTRFLGYEVRSVGSTGNHLESSRGETGSPPPLEDPLYTLWRFRGLLLLAQPPSIRELKDSIIMGNEELSTILEKESDKFIKSSVEELVPIPSESEDTIKSDSDCDLPSYISTDIENSYHDSEGDIIYLESLLIDDTILNLPPEELLDHNPRSLKDELDNDNLKSMVKVFDPRIWEKFFSPTYDSSLPLSPLGVEDIILIAWYGLRNGKVPFHLSVCEYTGIPVGMVVRDSKLVLSIVVLEITNARVGILGCYHRTGVLLQGAIPICQGSCRLTSLERQEVWNNCRNCKVRVGSNGNLLWKASVLLGREDVRKVFQQHGSGAKRKLSRCGRNQMGNEPILALPEGADDFVVYYDARSKDLEACLEKGRSEFDFEAKYHLGKANVDVVPWSRKKE
ncbi:hypothetical protein Tco_0199115 [Tanacetum coccineum]